jgi:SAM-dependent methyltransferase
MEKSPENTVGSEERLAKSRPWTELRGAADSKGLKDGEEALFRSTAERDEFYRRPLYGERFNTAAFLKPQREFNRMMFVKAGVRPGGRLLLIGEALEPIRLVELGRDTVAAAVEIVPLEMRHLALAHKAGRWPVYRELSAPYQDGEFDAVIAAQWHHCDELVPEFRALARIVKPGGKLVLVDNGPASSTFELAKQDVLLDYLLRQFVTWAGARHVPAEQAFDYQKATWLKNTVEEIVAAAAAVLESVAAWEYKGMAMVDGVRLS